METSTRSSRLGLLRRRGIVALSAILALGAALLSYSTVKPVSAATAHVFADTPGASVVHRPMYNVGGLTERAELLGRLMTSPPVAKRIATLAHVPAGKLASVSRITASVAAAYKEPGSEERASQILSEASPYRIEVEARPWTPVIDIYTHAPTTAEAERLADVAIVAVREQLHQLSRQRGLPDSDEIVLKPLGAAQGGVVNGGMAPAIALMAFLVAFFIAYTALRLLTRDPTAERPRIVMLPTRRDAWPHTGRLTPWTFAGFLGVIWLMPFSDILLDVPSPVDLSFDRLVLPIVMASWMLAALVRDGSVLRPRITPIHVAIAAFTVCAFLSVILDAAALNQSMELDGAVKQLPLLITYVSVFVIAATAMRADEVRAFLTYTLWLAVICALGVLWEYRFKQNLFYDWSDKLLPGIFKVGKVDPAGVDDIGRRVVAGPAMVPLEAVAMMAMALPIPLVRLTQAERTRDRILYGLAACLLFAACFATFRKSALIVPLSVIGTLAYFRRRELLKLAPLGLVVVVMIPLLAPGAVGMTTAQFQPDRLGVATVSDRSSDYDAVRPDLWTHLFFGRGWGTYDHATYRVLDSEILHRLIEMGVLGLLAFLFMILSVVWAARATIAERDPVWAPLALIGAAAAVPFGVASTLFDVLAFPHAVYIFLYMAGLTAAVLSRPLIEISRAPERRVRLEPQRAPVPT